MRVEAGVIVQRAFHYTRAAHTRLPAGTAGVWRRPLGGRRNSIQLRSTTMAIANQGEFQNCKGQTTLAKIAEASLNLTY